MAQVIKRIHTDRKYNLWDDLQLRRCKRLRKVAFNLSFDIWRQAIHVSPEQMVVAILSTIPSTTPIIEIDFWGRWLKSQDEVDLLLRETAWRQIFDTLRSSQRRRLVMGLPQAFRWTGGAKVALNKWADEGACDANSGGIRALTNVLIGQQI